MSFDQDLNACAAIVERGDPLRFRAAMAAPVAARKRLFPLYAFNVEVARAPWVTAEPMIAEMRLQWWRDALEEIAAGGPVRRHEVVTPLANVLDPQTAQMLDDLVVARRWDIYKDPFADDAHFARYLDHTSGHLMVAAARLLGRDVPALVRDAAYGVGVAGWLRAIPALEKAGRVPLLDGTSAGVKALASEGRARLQKARKNRSALPKQMRPALFPAIAADPVLKAAFQLPSLVGADALPTLGATFGPRALLGRW